MRMRYSRAQQNIAQNGKKLRKVGKYAFIFVCVALWWTGMGGADTTVYSASADRFGVEYGANIGLSTRDIRETIVNIIRIALGILGTVALVIALYGGVVWMTAGGDERKIETAKKILVNAVIGLVIIFSAFAIVQYIFNTLEGSRGGPGGPGSSCSTPNQCVACGVWCDATGTRVPSSACNYLCGTIPGGDSMRVEWASPRGANASLCTIVQFRVSSNAVSGLNPVSVNSATFKVTVNGATKGNGTACASHAECRSGYCDPGPGSCAGDIVDGSWSAIGRIGEFAPTRNWLPNQRYDVVVEGGLSGIRSNPLVTTGEELALASPYSWAFTTNDMEDTDPPRVREVAGVPDIYPQKNEADVCLATHIQARFTEPMRVSSLLAADSVLLSPAAGGWSKDAPSNDFLDAQPVPNLTATTNYTATLRGSVIQDACGNFLDGDGDGTEGGDYDVTDPWTFTTGSTAQCTPEITSIYPAQSYYDDPPSEDIVIVGRHFYGMGSVSFASNVTVVPGNPSVPGSGTAACLDSRGGAPTYYPDQLCLEDTDWTPTQIRLRAPAAGGSSNGAISGTVRVEVGGDRSNAVGITILSPHINSGPSPRRGGPGQYVTVSGAAFGSASGKIYFKSAVSRTLEYEAEPTGCAASTWSDTQVTVKVPETISIPAGVYYLQVEDSAGRRSNFAQNTFEVTNDPAGPGICAITPTCPAGGNGGAVGDARTIEGVHFGTAGEVRFGTVVASVTSWSDPTIIPVTVPAGIVTGNNPVVVVVAGKSSNAVAFGSPCGVGAPCDSDPTTPLSCEPGACPSGQQCTGTGCTCETIAPRPAVVDAWPSWCTAGVCTNSAAGVRFDRDMDTGSYSGNILFFSGCPDQACACSNASCSNLAPVAGNLTAGVRTADFAPAGNLQPDTIYRGLVRGGTGGVRDAAGEQLRNLNFDTDGAGGNDAYSWVFQTKANSAGSPSSCAVDYIDVIPTARSVAIGAAGQLEAIPYSYNVSCSTRANRLNVTSGFTWQSCAVASAAQCGVSCPSGTGIASVSPGATSNFASSQGVSAGSVFACAAYQGSAHDGGQVTVTSPCGSDADCRVGLCTASTCITSGVNKGRCTPEIAAVTPPGGDIGSWVTVAGCHFGDTPGVAMFMGSSGAVLARFPSDSNPQCVGDEWTDREIILEVPDVTGTTDNAVDGPIMITTTRLQTAVSPFDFDVNGNSYPGICRLSPTAGDIGETVRVYGKGFGASRSTGDEVVYSTAVPSVSYPAGASCPAGGWSDGAICSEVPAGAITGNVVVALASGSTSNPKMFTVAASGGGVGDSCNTAGPSAPACSPDSNACNEGLWCDPDPASDPLGVGCTCQTTPAPTASFDPADGSAGTCLNAVFSVTFDQRMDWASIASSTRPGLYFDANIPAVADCADFGLNTWKDWSIAQAHAEEKGVILRLVRWLSSWITEVFAQPPASCQVPHRLEFEDIPDTPGECASFDGNGCTRVYLKPLKALPNMYFQFGVNDYGDPAFGAKSVYGVPAAPGGAANLDFTFAGICQIDFVEVALTPPGRVGSSDLFVCVGDTCAGDAADGLDNLGQPSSEPVIAGNQHLWQARAKTRVTSPASLVLADFTWDENDPDNLYVLQTAAPTDPFESAQYVTAQADRDGSAKIKITANDPDPLGTAGSAASTVSVTTAICDVPWPGSTPYIDSTYNFSLWYCREKDQEYECDSSSPENMRGQICTPGVTDCGTGGSCVARTSDDLPALQLPFTQGSSINICDLYSGTATAYCGTASCLPGARCVGGVCNMKSLNPGQACTDDSGCASHPVSCQPDLLQENFIPVAGLVAGSPDETIGLRVIRNAEHLSSQGWYSVYRPEVPSPKKIDGYDAVEYDRTVYVAAANDTNGDASGGTVYTNIYTMSFCKSTVSGRGQPGCEPPGSGGTVETIFDQLVANWRFNINMRDVEKMSQLRRDTARVGHLGDILRLAEYSRTLSGGEYLTLGSGSYIEGISTSKWAASWYNSGGVLPNAFGQVPPSDPLNDIYCPSDYDQSSCWKGGIGSATGLFNCGPNSHIYLYKSNGSGNPPSVYANLEYADGSWDGLSVAAPNSLNPCTGAHFCGCFNLQR